MTIPDSKAAGEFSVFYAKEIIPLKDRLAEEYSGNSFDDAMIQDMDIETLCRAAWQAGRAYGRNEEK